jgi:hypothetical protein
MRGFLLGLSFSIVFILGFVAAQLVPGAQAGKKRTRIDVPPLVAPTPTWEYICYRAELTLDLLDVANQAGEQGWEMVGTDGQGARSPVWCFKRRRSPS